MVLIKPPQACSTAEVYKVMVIGGWSNSQSLCNRLLFIHSPFYLKKFLHPQRLQLDKTSKVDPLNLLEKLSSNGISQDVCINDLGKWMCWHFILSSLFCFRFGKLLMSFFPLVAQMFLVNRILLWMLMIVTSSVSKIDIVFHFVNVPSFPCRVSSIWGIAISQKVKAACNGSRSWTIWCCFHVWKVHTLS